MSSQTDTSTKKKRGIPWYVYFGGSTIYTALGGWLAADSSPLAIVCINSRSTKVDIPRDSAFFLGRCVGLR